MAHAAGGDGVGAGADGAENMLILTRILFDVPV